ncbi:endothelin B receptor-like [Orbicella faveolata]|uniref:endothelin B receptor-like n=1 Tax=Orbicella faveolata TaxID=48498 RepID=UPI0009E58F26|nr:endothelin B receptor-like [Orbicella faveolata]
MSWWNNTTDPLNSSKSAQDQVNSTCPFVDSTAERFSKLFAYCFILPGSLFGNIFIIIIVYKNRDLRKTINYFIVNMALSDLVFSLIILPVKITELVTDSRHWYVSGILGAILCKLFFFAGYVSFLVSTQSLVWIAIDRFVAVVFPMKLGLISSKIRTIAIVSTWICAGFVNFPLLISSKLVARGNDTACAETNMESFFFNKKANVTYVWLQFSLLIIAPLVVITVMYTAITITLKLQRKGSFFGNTFIIIIVYKHQLDLPKTINYFIVNMAVSDLLFSLILLPVQITQLVTMSLHWHVGGILGSRFCKLFYFASSVSLLVSAQSLVWIAVDRFVAVVFPIKLGLISSKICTKAVVSMWVLAGVSISHRRFQGYYLLHATICFLAPLFVITVLYTAIAISLKRISKTLMNVAQYERQHSAKKRRRATKMTIVILVLFYICVIPQTVLPFSIENIKTG